MRLALLPAAMAAAQNPHAPVTMPMPLVRTVFFVDRGSWGPSQCIQAASGNNEEVQRLIAVLKTSLSCLWRRPVALVVFIDGQFCYIKSGVGMDQYEPTERHMSFCTWTLIPVNPEILVRAVQ